MSPRFTVSEALTHPSTKRSQPALLKVCSWMKLKRYLPHPSTPTPQIALKSTLGRDGARKPQRRLVSLSQAEPRTSSLCLFPSHPRVPSPLTAFPFLLHTPHSSVQQGQRGPCLHPASTKTDGLPWPELKPASIWEKDLSVGN